MACEKNLAGRLHDLKALVTGGGRGIGKALALALAREGADVGIAYNRGREQADATAGEIRAMGRRCEVLQTDIAVKAQTDRMVNDFIGRFGQIDVLVNNAGAVSKSKAENFPEEAWNRDLGVNLSGHFFCSQAAAKHMIPRRKGSIINISSFAAYVAIPYEVGYCAAKAGLVSMTRVLATEWGAHNVRVNCVAPGFVWTDMAAEQVEKGLRSREEVDRITQRIPLKRYGRPEDIGGVVVFLASDESSFVNGETITVDGGWMSYGYL